MIPAYQQSSSPPIEPEPPPPPGQPGSTAGQIDHRQARRLVVQIPLLLRLRPDQCFFGIARNLSPDGIFVETIAAPDRNACVDVVIPGLRLLNAAPAVLPTLLVHRSPLGLGLMFRSLDQRTAAALEGLLCESRSAHLLAGAQAAAQAADGGRFLNRSGQVRGQPRSPVRSQVRSQVSNQSP